MSGGRDPWNRPPAAPPPSSGGAWWLALMVGVGGLIGFLAWRFPGSLESERDWLRIVYLVGLLALVSSGMVAGRRARLRETAKSIAAWLAIALLAIAAYGYRYEIEAVGERVLGELLPGHGVATGAAEVAFRVGANGHFRVEAVVDGVPLAFLVDTGASDVVLSRADAGRLGFDPANLAYTQVYYTANGRVRGAPVNLGEIAVGPIRLRNVAASVNEADMVGSLLGMSFLGRLSAYEVSNGALTLRQ